MIPPFDLEDFRDDFVEECFVDVPPTFNIPARSDRAYRAVYRLWYALHVLTGRLAFDLRVVAAHVSPPTPVLGFAWAAVGVGRAEVRWEPPLTQPWAMVAELPWWRRWFAVERETGCLYLPFGVNVLWAADPSRPPRGDRVADWRQRISDALGGVVVVGWVIGGMWLPDLLAWGLRWVGVSS